VRLARLALLPVSLRVWCLRRAKNALCVEQLLSDGSWRPVVRRG
jgi:hypothetical protein